MSRSIHWLVTSDGVRLRYGRWSVPKPRAIAVVLTGRNEFIEKYDEVARELTQRNFEVWSLDWRGQGLSTRALPQRERGYVASFVYYLSDLRAFLRIVRQSSKLPLMVFGHSMGGHVALRYMHDFPDAIDAAVLTAPMIDMTTRRYPPGLAKLIAEVAVVTRFATRYAPSMRDYDPKRDLFDGNDATSDRGRFERRVRLLSENPQLRLGGVTFGWVAAAYRSIVIAQAPQYLAGITTPLLIFAAGDDRVVNTEAIFEAQKAMRDCRVVMLDGSRHEVMQENDTVRGQFWHEVDRFLLERKL